LKASGLRVNFEVAMALDLGNASVPSVVRKVSRQRSLRRSVLRLEKPEDTENPVSAAGKQILRSPRQSSG